MDTFYTNKKQAIRKYFRENPLLYGVGEAVLGALYPRRCPFCDKVLVDQGVRICKGCAARLPWVREPRCKKCGAPIESDTAEYCGICRAGRHVFLENEAAFLYEGEMRDAVLRMKFYNRREYLEFFAQALYVYAGEYLTRIRPEMLLPIPMHSRKKRERGFDQCRILADYLSSLTGLPSPEGVVKRTRYTLPQKGLAREERKRNLKGAFTVLHPEVLPETVLLLDDIFTTGSTLDEMSTVLGKCGVKKVYSLSLCIGRGREVM